jgi:4-amino-4-deoxy-L-arabinose transferase-like glycosyltransferase
MIVAYHIFGVNAFAARFFSALLGILLIVITFLFVKKIKGSSVALLTILILASSTHLLFEFRLSVPDPYLIFFFTLTMLSLYGYLKSEKALPLYLASVAMALAVLSKGPVALGLAGVPVLVWMTWEKKLKLIWKPQMLVAVLLFVSITLPWYWLVHQKTNGAFTNGFFLEQNLNRFSQPMEGHGGWFILVPLFVWVGLLPFSSFLM